MGLAGKGLDEEGARRVVEEHYDDVLAYCRRHAPTYDDALDATQEAFLRFVRSLPGYHDRGKPLAFLLTVARRVCADAYRRRGRTWEQLDENAAADEPQGGGVREALCSLPPEQREVPLPVRKRLQAVCGSWANALYQLGLAPGAAPSTPEPPRGGTL